MSTSATISVESCTEKQGSGWVTCNGVAQILGALIMYGVGLSDKTAIATWRVMFLVCGGGTLLSGALFTWLMPRGPDTAWFLTESERAIASKRLSEDRLSKDATSFKTSQIWEFVKDHRALLLVLGAFTNTLASPVIKVSSYYLPGMNTHLMTQYLVRDSCHQRLWLVKAQHHAR